MTGIVVFLVFVIMGGLWLWAKDRGKDEAIRDLDDQAREQDKGDVQNELDKKRNSDAWDNLNDTIDDIGK